MTDPTYDPEMTPLSLVQQLRLTADDLTSTYVAVDADGDPIGERLMDGSEEDFDDPLDPVEFEPEALHDMAALYRKAADELEEAELLREQANVEIARLTEALGASADPPNRAPLLASLEELTGPEMASACGNEVVQTIRDAIAAIRTDARVIEASRGQLKGWHDWARKLARAEGDEYANARPERLRARISAQHEAGSLALLIAPIHRRVQLVQDLCADMGLGMQEAAELVPKAALWTDAEVAEIETFRTKPWAKGVNPFDHLPPALERTVYPEPGGRRAYFKRIGEPLPPEAPKPEEAQQILPGLPKPETALRLRLALIDKPDSPEVALVAGFAQALLEKLDAVHRHRGYPADHHPWMHNDWAEVLRAQARLHVEKGDPRDVAAYCAFAWHHGWSLAGGAPHEAKWALIQMMQPGVRLPDIYNLFTGTFSANAISDHWPAECERLTETMIAVSAAEYGRLWCLASALGGLEGMGALAKERDEFGGWLVTTFQPGHVDEAAVLMPREEYESGAAFCRRVLQLALDRGAFAVGSGRIEGLRSEEVPDQWAQIAGELWQVLAEIEGVDPWAFTTSDSLNIGYSNEVRRLAARRLHLLSAEAVVNRGPLPAVWREWACEVIGGGVDGTEAELQALIGRMLATANKLRRQNQLAFDALASGPLPMVAPSHPLDAQMATTADVAERARAAASNLRYAMGHPQESPDPTPAAMQDAVQVLTVAAAVLGATQADPSDAPRG